MMNKKIGAITLGQSPRTDMVDVISTLPDYVEIVEYGILDDFDEKAIANIKIHENDFVLTSRLRSGQEVKIPKSLVLSKIQAGVDFLESQDVDLIMMWCTDDFKNKISSKILLLEPSKLLVKLVPYLYRGKHITLVTPSVEQKKQTLAQWEEKLPGYDYSCVAASPYLDEKEHARAIKAINEMHKLQLIILDCIGFTKKMKQLYSAKTGMPVILPRSILINAASELI